MAPESAERVFIGEPISVDMGSGGIRVDSDDDTKRDGSEAIGGGLGHYAAFGRPDLVLAAPGGIYMATPASITAAAGNTTTLISSGDINVTAQRHHAVVAQDGIVWFAYGRKSAEKSPVDATGIALHAASGNVHVEAAGGAAHLAADKKLTVASTTDAVTVQSATLVRLCAGGSSLTINSEGITLTTPGPAAFRAAMKELTGAGSASQTKYAPASSKLASCLQSLQTAAAAQAGAVELG